LIYFKPSLLAGAYIFLIFILFGCGTISLPIGKSSNDDLNLGTEMTAIDYADHLSSLKSSFVKTPGIKILHTSGPDDKYLTGLLREIIEKNEIFFKSLKSGSVSVLDTNQPLHLSLPRGEIFLSRGLINKYLKHESILVSVLAYELVRSEKLLYPKETIVPVGFLSLDRLINLNRLNVDEKMEVHKWAYHITIRSGYDGEYYLSWLQTQNRNTADFIMQVGDINQINKEESLFKAFLIRQPQDDELMTIRKNSSKFFYKFINSIRDRSI